MAKKKATTPARTATAKKSKAAKRPTAQTATAETAVKTRTPKANGKAATPVKRPKGRPKGSGKPVPAVRLTEKQQATLQTVAAAGETGHSDYSKTDARSLDALKTRKLVKTGAKDKATGRSPYQLTKAGRKVLDDANSAGA